MDVSDVGSDAGERDDVARLKGATAEVEMGKCGAGVGCDRETGESFDGGEVLLAHCLPFGTSFFIQF